MLKILVYLFFLVLLFFVSDTDQRSIVLKHSISKRDTYRNCPQGYAILVRDRDNICVMLEYPSKTAGSGIIPRVKRLKPLKRKEPTVSNKLQKII